MTKLPKNSLGLGGDGDEIIFVEEIESAFGIRFQREDMDGCATVGDIYDALCRHVQPVERGSFPCLTAAAYRRVRKAIAESGTRAHIGPDTCIADLVDERRLEKWWDALQLRCGLKLPPLCGGDWKILLGFAACGFALLATFPLLILDRAGQLDNAGLWLWSLYGLAALAIAVAVWAPYKRSTPYATVGDVARAVSALNAGTLSQVHGAIRAREAWSVLVWIAREVTPHDGPIDRETVLIG
jgi:hypothetical protein